MFRKILIAAVAVLGLGFAGVSAASAAPSSSVARNAPADFNVKNMCDSESQYVCLSANGTLGDQVDVKYFNNDNQQNFDVNQVTGECGNGYVTTTCPFNKQNLDKQYAGAEIVTLQNHSTGYILVPGTALDHVVQASHDTQTGSLWVKAPTGGNPAYVNVYASDNDVVNCDPLGQCAPAFLQAGAVNNLANLDDSGNSPGAKEKWQPIG